MARTSLSESTSSTSTGPRFNINTLLLVGIALLVVYICYHLLNPVAMWQTSKYKSLIEDVSTRANVTPAELQYIGRIKEDAALKDVEEIKKESPINAEVYKDAKNGDYVLAYASKMVIYNEDDDKVVYDGDTPGMKQAKEQEAAIQKIVDQLKAKGVVPQNVVDKPQAAVISDPKALAGNSFYRDAKAGDMVLSFANTGITVIYNTQTQAVVNVAKLNFVEPSAAAPADTTDTTDTGTTN